MKPNKRAAMEMSVGTIVTIVLLLSVLILGLYFTRNVMCSGIIMTDQINQKVQNEVLNLFAEDDYGVKCLGEGSEEAVLGDGGRRHVFCVIKTKENAEYELKIVDIEVLKGMPEKKVKEWVLSEGWKGNVLPGKDNPQTVLLLDVPDSVTDTSLKIKIESTNKDTGTPETHYSYVDITHVGGISSAVC